MMFMIKNSEFAPLKTTSSFSDAKKADDRCWNELNKKANEFGTCSPTSNVVCPDR